MAFQDFWMNVRTAAGTIARQAVVDSPRLDPNEIEQTLRGGNQWFTPRAVERFDVKEFEFLPLVERERLADLVKDFRAFTSRVDPKEPVSEGVLERARALFRDILLLLEFNRYGDPEAYRLGKQIEQVVEAHRPQELAELRFNTGLDHSGDPAIWIWGFLTEEAAATDDQFLENATKLRDWLDPIARRIAPDRWPFLSFRSIAEEADLVKAS
jgi:hypothetical protein